MVDFEFLTLTSKHVPYKTCTSLIWVLYIMSIFLDHRHGFEPTFQLKGCNLRARPSKWKSYEGFNLDHRSQTNLVKDVDRDPSFQLWAWVPCQMAQFARNPSTLCFDPTSVANTKAVLLYEGSIFGWLWLWRRNLFPAGHYKPLWCEFGVLMFQGFHVAFFSSCWECQGRETSKEARNMQGVVGTWTCCSWGKLSTRANRIDGGSSKLSTWRFWHKGAFWNCRGILLDKFLDSAPILMQLNIVMSLTCIKY